MQEFPEDVERVAQQSDEQSFAYPRSVVVGVFVLCGLALVLLKVQLGDRLSLEVPKFGQAELSGDISKSLLEAEDEQLKRQDSDEDGLTDYQELRIYGTSPFIADSDSDGETDAAEIAAGTDPNCPEGQNCFQPQTAFTGGTLQEVLANQQDRLQGVLDSPSEIRRLLIEQGASPALLANIDDQSLQILANEAYQEYSKPKAETIDLLAGLNADQLRALLVSAGLSEAQVQGLTDNELTDLVQSVLTQQRGQIQPAQ